MAVSEQTPLKAHTANGATTVFAFDFLILDEDDLTVLVDGSEVAAADYTVAGVDVDAGGTVTFDTAPAADSLVVLLRDSVVSRETDYQSNGDLLAAVINRDMDRLWLVLQEVEGGGKASTAAVRAPLGEALDALPVAEDRALRILSFDSRGQPLLIPGVDDSSAASLALDLADSTTAAKGAALLGASVDLEYPDDSIGASMYVRNVKQHGAARANSAAANRTAIQSAITAAQSLGKSAVIVIPGDIDYGYDSLDDTTWPSQYFSGVTVSVVIHDYAPGVVSGANTTGAQHREWMHTPQTSPTPGLHDGNGRHVFGNWHPYQWVGVNGGIPAVRTANDNLRASYFVGVDNEAAFRIGQGTLSSSTLTKEQLSNPVWEVFPLTGDTITGSNWGLFLGERETRRMSYGGGANNPLAAHDFYPGNASETLDLALFRTPSATTTVSLQSSAGTSARSFIRNNAGVTEIGAQTGGAAIKIRQADSFAEYGSGSSYTYHHSIQASRASNWISFVNNTNATDGFVQRMQSTSTQAAGWSFLACYANAGADQRLVIAGTGNVTNANNSYGAISDVKLKQDITDAGSAWDDLKAYRFRKFRFKSDPAGPLQLGVIAQELAAVSPGLVEAVPDYDEASNLTGESTLTVKYSVLLLKAAVALQEAMRRIEALEAKVNP